MAWVCRAVAKPAPRNCRQAAGEVVAVVPWQVLSWHTVNLPPGVGQRSKPCCKACWKTQLAARPARHAFGGLSPLSGKALRKAAQVLVLACAKAWLRQALAPLQAAGVRVQRLVPELQPREPIRALHLLNDNGQLQALLCQADTVWRLPPQAAAAASSGPHRQACERVWAEPSVAEHANRWTEQPAPASNLRSNVGCKQQTSEWNLAQGEWAQNSRLRGQRWLQQAWRSAVARPRMAQRRGVLCWAGVWCSWWA